MKFKAGTITLTILLVTISLATISSVARAQQTATTLTLGPNQIGLVKTTQGITTRITFPDAVRDIICGDLYDSNTGKGGFVIQRIDNDVFLKPVVAKGLSNLFVKTGEKGDNTYSFDLEVVSTSQAYRIVNITNAPTAPAAQAQQSAAADQTPESAQKVISVAQQQADEMIRSARQQSEQILAQANQRASEVYAQALKRTEELDRQAARRAEQQVEDRFVRAMIQGVRDVKTNESHSAAKKVIISLDSRVLTFDEKSYLRYTIKNTGDKEFSFSAISLETGSEKNRATIPIKVIQGRVENRLKPGDTIMGIIVFDPKTIGPEDKLTLYVRGEGNADVARLSIQ